VITLITNKSDTNLFKNMITTFDIVGGADAERIGGNKTDGMLGNNHPCDGFNLNTVSITSGFKSRGFES
jgi:hypothetical protein